MNFHTLTSHMLFGLESKRNIAAALQRPAGVSEEEFFAKHCPPPPANFGSQVNAPSAMRKRHDWTLEQWPLHHWAYCRLTEEVDRSIGRILQALREAGLDENTLVVFTSDHGEMNGPTPTMPRPRPKAARAKASGFDGTQPIQTAEPI